MGKFNEMPLPEVTVRLGDVAAKVKYIDLLYGNHQFSQQLNFNNSIKY
jgi:hypothetical protein